ncbi:MAG: hypothetical protein FRX49_02930 [Trebouxia sp. A1-2]|nr:MAG: hypothetical protein FRX49_02930 [Trebouxia sp. A1-2]
MNRSFALFNGLSRAAGRTIVTGILRPGRALAIGLHRPSHKIPQPQEKLSESTECFMKAVGSSVAAPTLLAVVRLYALVQRIDLAVQAKDELLSKTLANLGPSKADAAAPERLARALLGLVANTAQRPHGIWLAAEDVARSRMDSVFKWVMHLVTGGGGKQLAGIMMQAEADLDELIVAYSESMVDQYKVVGASTGLAIHLWAIIQGGYLPALMSDLVPAASCAVAMGLLGLDLTLPGSPHAQEVPMAACDLQQLEEALTLAAASRPAAPIKADDSPALQQPALHEGELTALPADVQSVSIHLLHQGAASPAEAPAGGQSEGSLALQQAPAPDTKVDSQEVPAKEAVPSGGACSKQQQDSTASLVSDAKRDGISIQAGPVPSSPVEAHNSPQGVKEAARPAVPATRSQAEAATSSPVKAPSSPQSLQERDSPVSPMKEMSFAGAADTLAGARATMVTPVTTESTHPELTDKAAAEATAGVPPANVCASQPVTPATTESTHPELTDRAAAQAATGVPPAVADASLDSKEEEAGHAAEAHAAGAAQGKGSATQPSATMSEAEPKASAEDMAAPNSSSALSEANVEPSTHAAKGFTDNRTAADSPEADIRAKAVPNGPAEEFSVGDTIAAKHAAGSAFTTPKTSASSSPAQTKPERQAAKSKGLSEGEYEVVPGADYLEQLKDPHKRRLSDGATAVVNLARVRSMADLAQLQAPPYLGPLQPGQQVVIKVVKGIDRENLRDLAEHEEEVLRALTGKPYVPQFFASFRTEDVEEGSGVVRPCANLIMGLVEGWDLQTILKAVQKKVRKLKTGSSKLLKLKAWVWHFSMHLAHALAQILHDVHKDGRSHRDIKPHNIVVSWKNGKVTVTLIDWAGSRLRVKVGSADLLNAAFTPPYASPQLICFFGLVQQAMVDEPNDMWAAAMVVYQTIISADAKGLKDHGDWMFGPTALQYEQIVQLPSKEQDSAVRNAIQQEQQLWASKANNAGGLDFPHQFWVLHRAAQGVQFAGKGAQVLGVKKLLAAMLHPAAEKRMTAEQMHELEWLQEAAAVPLSECPISI